MESALEILPCIIVIINHKNRVYWVPEYQLTFDFSYQFSLYLWLQTFCYHICWLYSGSCSNSSATNYLRRHTHIHVKIFHLDLEKYCKIRKH